LKIIYSGIDDKQEDLFFEEFARLFEQKLRKIKIKIKVAEVVYH